MGFWSNIFGFAKGHKKTTAAVIASIALGTAVLKNDIIHTASASNGQEYSEVEKKEFGRIVNNLGKLHYDLSALESYIAANKINTAKKFSKTVLARYDTLLKNLKKSHKQKTLSDYDYENLNARVGYFYSELQRSMDELNPPEEVE